MMTAKKPAAAFVLALALVAAGTAVLLVGCDEGVVTSPPPADPASSDTRPSFGAQTVPEQTYTVGERIDPLVLPEATGGNAPLQYNLAPEVPGLSFLPLTRTLIGTPTETSDYAMVYWVEDSDGDVATLHFDVQVKRSEPPELDAEPSFGAQTVADQAYTVGEAIAEQVLPAASGGNAPLQYSLTPEVPGLRFYPSTRTLSGRPTAAAEGVHAMTYRVEDVDGDAATLNFEVRIDPAPAADTRPSFGAQTVADQAYTVGEAITPLTLPEASGTGTLYYSLRPVYVPAGLTFTEATRTLSGTPTRAGSYDMLYKATDMDNRAATLRFTIVVNLFSANRILGWELVDAVHEETKVTPRPRYRWQGARLIEGPPTVTTASDGTTTWEFESSQPIVEVRVMFRFPANPETVIFRYDMPVPTTAPNISFRPVSTDGTTELSGYAASQIEAAFDTAGDTAGASSAPPFDGMQFKSTSGDTGGPARECNYFIPKECCGSCFLPLSASACLEGCPGS